MVMMLMMLILMVINVIAKMLMVVMMKNDLYLHNVGDVDGVDEDDV